MSDKKDTVLKTLLTTLFEFYIRTSVCNVVEHLSSSEENYYNYIRSRSDITHLMLTDLKENNDSIAGKKFIDIGCGFPIIPSIMHLLGECEPFGLEYNKAVVKVVNDCKKQRPRRFEVPSYSDIHITEIFQGNLLTHNFKKFDILYSYNPIRDHDLMYQGLKRITETMKKGATFYFNEAGIKLQELDDLGFTRISNNGTSLFKFVKS